MSSKSAFNRKLPIGDYQAIATVASKVAVWWQFCGQAATAYCVFNNTQEPCAEDKNQAFLGLGPKYQHNRAKASLFTSNHASMLSFTRSPSPILTAD